MIPIVQVFWNSVQVSKPLKTFIVPNPAQLTQIQNPRNQNIYGALTEKNWNNHQEIKTVEQYLLDMDHSETVQKHTAK